MNIKKIVYGTTYAILGTEVTAIGLNFYKLYISGASIPFVAGQIICPWWMLLEGTMIGFAPILTKMFIKALSNEEISDDSNLANLIQKINNNKGDKNGIDK
jgi:hypothetical protein